MESHLKVAVVILGVLAVQFLGNGPAFSAAQAETSPTTAPTTTPAAGASTSTTSTTTTAAGATTPTTTTSAGATTPTTTTAAGATTPTTTAPPSSCTCCSNCTTMEAVVASNQRWMSCQKYYTAGGSKTTTFTVIPDNQGQCMMSGSNCSQCCPQCLFCTQKNGAWLASCVSCPPSATGKPM